MVSSGYIFLQNTKRFHKIIQINTVLIVLFTSYWPIQTSFVVMAERLGLTCPSKGAVLASPSQF